MQNTLFYLSTCDTCKEILKLIDLKKYHFILQDIKTAPITEKQLKELVKITGNYESLFSKRAQLYKSLNLASKTLSEKDYHDYLLQHYTFLKRPVIIYDKDFFIGSEKKTVARLKAYFEGRKSKE